MAAAETEQALRQADAERRARGPAGAAQGRVAENEMERAYLTLTLVSAVISVLLIFFGAFLLGLWCGWMWWGSATDE